jgi:hypothetical protein
MAHFAQVVDGIVTNVVVVPDSHEADGPTFLADTLGLGGVWVQTSYNTYGNSHPSGTPLRYNYAGIGFTYDADRDAFIPPKPDGEWVLDEATCLWVSP